MLRLCELLEPAPHALGLDELVLGRLHRPLHPSLLNGHLARLENLLTANGHEWTRKFHHKDTKDTKIKDPQITQISVQGSTLLTG